MSSEICLTQAPKRLPSAARSFDDTNMLDRLNRTDARAFDELEFGAIALRRDGLLEHYNALEARWSGLLPTSVIGRNFFSEVAPCTNNAIIGGRLLNENTLDIELDYVFTYRLIPTKVRLRLLKGPSSPLMYLLVRMRGA